MKLTDEQINQAAAELLGIEWQKYDNYGIRNPDFIHDANAVRRLIKGLKAEQRVEQQFKAAAMLCDLFVKGDTSEVSAFVTALNVAPKHITLAVLCAAGKLTLEQAKEAMSDE